MSSGFRSASLFGCEVPSISPPLSWPPCPPPPASTGLKLVVEALALLTGRPSTTNSGSELPLIVRKPRILMDDDAPGSPADEVTSTPGALAASACTMLLSFAFTIRSAETLFRTLPSFSTSVAVPAPVMTTSPSCSGLFSRAKSWVMLPLAMVRRALRGL